MFAEAITVDNDLSLPLWRVGPLGTMPVMGKRSGIPHRDGELAALSLDELRAELERSRVRLSIAGSAMIAKQWHKRIHWLERAIGERS